MSEQRREFGINYVELGVANMAATKEFYGKAFGWSFQDWGDDYVSFAGAGVDGGFRSDAEGTIGRALIILYSANLEGALERVTAAGGAILKPIFSFPGGRRFHFADPAGNELAIWSDG